MSGRTGASAGGTLGEQLKQVVAIIPADQVPATVNGPAIDRQRFNVGVLVVQGGAAIGGPSAQTADYLIQEADAAAGPWTNAVKGAFGDVVTTQETADNFIQELEIDFRKMKAFVRVQQLTALTGGTSWPQAASMVLGAAVRELPAV